MKSKLYLIRHGQSTYNLENRFTGWKDVGLTSLGEKQSKEAVKKYGSTDSGALLGDILGPLLKKKKKPKKE